MQPFRWSLAVTCVYGSLLFGGVGGFALLHQLGWLHWGDASLALYWLVVLPFILFFGAWLLLVVWCFLDAQRRGMNASRWALLVLFLGFPVGPLVYWVLRRSDRSPPSSEV